MTVKKLRVGIIGFGAVGKIRYDILKKNESVTIISISDQNINSQKEFLGDLKLYENFNLMIENEELDLVFIALPNYLAAEATILSLQKNLHVFCEKPPARNPREFREVILIAEKSPKLKLMYGFNHRFHPSVKKAKDLIDSKEFGEILNLRGEYGKSAIIKFSKDEWRANRKFSGGGILLDQGIHLLDLMRYFGGRFDVIHSIVKNSYWNYDVEDNAYALLESNDGIVGLIHSSATLWRHSFRLEIGLTKGSISLTGILSSTKSYGNETIKLTKANFDKIGEPEEVLLTFMEDTSWSEETNLFIHKILNNQNIDSGNSHEALETLELVYKIYKSDPIWDEKFSINKDS
jgi:predicted dehydrogenase